MSGRVPKNISEITQKVQTFPGVPVIFRQKSLTGFLLLAFPSCTRLHAQNIDVSPRLIRFPNQGIHFASSIYSVTVLNNQTSTLKISSIQAMAPFAQSNNCGTSIAPNASCTINVTFIPTAVQYYTGTVTLTDSAGKSPQVVNVDGNGILPIKYSRPSVGFFQSPDWEHAQHSTAGNTHQPAGRANQLFRHEFGCGVSVHDQLRRRTWRRDTRRRRKLHDIGHIRSASGDDLQRQPHHQRERVRQPRHHPSDRLRNFRDASTRYRGGSPPPLPAWCHPSKSSSTSNSSARPRPR